MFKKSQLNFIAAVTAIGIASPALAQSFDPDVGTGNLVGINVAPAAPQTAAAARASGLHAYAMVPRASAPTASTDPAATGGGSAGYNAMLLQY